MTASLGFDRKKATTRRHYGLTQNYVAENENSKEMNNVQSQTKIKLHQIIRKILARYLYSSLDPLQRKKTLQQITRNKNQNLQF